jgi:hypothetical protein
LSKTDFLYSGIKFSVQEKDEKDTTKSDDNANLDLLTLDKSKYADAVIEISNQFFLDPTIVASILFDYKIWDEASSDEFVE